jgi:hypothetical protein
MASIDISMASWSLTNLWIRNKRIRNVNTALGWVFRMNHAEVAQGIIWEKDVLCVLTPKTLCVSLFEGTFEDFLLQHQIYMPTCTETCGSLVTPRVSCAHRKPFLRERGTLNSYMLGQPLLLVPPDDTSPHSLPLRYPNIQPSPTTTSLLLPLSSTKTIGCASSKASSKDFGGLRPLLATQQGSV